LKGGVAGAAAKPKKKATPTSTITKKDALKERVAKTQKYDIIGHPQIQAMLNTISTTGTTIMANLDSNPKQVLAEWMSHPEKCSIEALESVVEVCKSFKTGTVETVRTRFVFVS